MTPEERIKQLELELVVARAAYRAHRATDGEEAMTPIARQNIISITILILSLNLLGNVFLIWDLEQRVSRIERFIGK